MRMSVNEEVTDNVISSIITFVEDNLQQHFDLEKLSAQFCISKYYLSHLFKRETGLSVIKFCNERRICLAKTLLNESLPITEIACRCGYDSASYFSKKFKEETGITPKQYGDTIRSPFRK